MAHTSLSVDSSSKLMSYFRGLSKTFVVLRLGKICVLVAPNFGGPTLIGIARCIRCRDRQFWPDSVKFQRICILTLDDWRSLRPCSCLGRQILKMLRHSLTEWSGEEFAEGAPAKEMNVQVLAMVSFGGWKTYGYTQIARST